MKLRSGLVLSSLLSLGLLTYACANGDTVSGSTGSGGSGNNNTGGSNSNNNTGGSNSNNNTGGSNSNNSGGSQGSGGVRATGGATGGSNSTGSGSGGTTTTGSSGGSTDTTGAGGSTAMCGTSFAVNGAGYVTSPGAMGTCLHGYAYNFADAASTITPGTSMTYAMCGSPCKLTGMGMVAAATMANSYATYAGIGFNLNQDQSGGTATPTLTPKGTGLTVAFSGTYGTLSLRAQITDGTKIWCYSITGASPVTIPYSSFNTQCWVGGSGVAYAKEPINAFQLQAAGAAAADSFNLTLTSVTEN